MNSQLHLPLSPTVPCARGESPRRWSGSWSDRFCPTTFKPMPCSRTSGCAGSAYASSTRPSNGDSSKSSEPSMSSAVCRPASAAAIAERFEEAVLPYLGDANRLARWLLRNEHDAEDVVQEASLRAFRYFQTFT